MICKTINKAELDILKNTNKVKYQSLLLKLKRTNISGYKRYKMGFDIDYKSSVNNRYVRQTEQSFEDKIPITHIKYRLNDLGWNKKLVENLKPKILLTIKYRDVVANNRELLLSKFAHIKDILISRHHRFLHYIETGIDASLHSHIILSNSKNSYHLDPQIAWLSKHLSKIKYTSFYGISDCPTAIDVRRSDGHLKYLQKQTNLNLLTLDITNL